MRTDGPGESVLLLLDVVDVLTEREIGYAVIGALAASIYGAIRVSADSDLVLSVGMSEARQLESVLSAAGFQTELRQGDFSDPIPGLLEAKDGFGNRVDLLIGLRGLEPEAFQRTREVPFHGAALRFIGLEDFIAMKVFAGGPVDLKDARRAVETAGTSLDRALVRRLATRYGADALQAFERLTG